MFIIVFHLTCYFLFLLLYFPYRHCHAEYKRKEIFNET
nr:MAG TPA: hypothetical protein [Caudoviricetes sp.]